MWSGHNVVSEDCSPFILQLGNVLTSSRFWMRVVSASNSCCFCSRSCNRDKYIVIYHTTMESITKKSTRITKNYCPLPFAIICHPLKKCCCCFLFLNNPIYDAPQNPLFHVLRRKKCPCEYCLCCCCSLNSSLGQTKKWREKETREEKKKNLPTGVNCWHS